MLKQFTKSDDLGKIEKDRLVSQAAFSNFTRYKRSALTSFVTLLGLVDNIDPALAAHDLAIAVTLLERAERVCDFHGALLTSRRGERHRLQFTQ